jgi:hypothetical protein
VAIGGIPAKTGHSPKGEIIFNQAAANLFEPIPTF